MDDVGGSRALSLDLLGDAAAPAIRETSWGPAEAACPEHGRWGCGEPACLVPHWVIDLRAD